MLYKNRFIRGLVGKQLNGILKSPVELYRLRANTSCGVYCSDNYVGDIFRYNTKYSNLDAIANHLLFKHSEWWAKYFKHDLIHCDIGGLKDIRGLIKDEKVYRDFHKPIPGLQIVLRSKDGMEFCSLFPRTICFNISIFRNPYSPHTLLLFVNVMFSDINLVKLVMEYNNRRHLYPSASLSSIINHYWEFIY